MPEPRKFREALEADAAFTGKMALDFAFLIAAQAEEVYKRKGICFPVTVSSTLLYLSRVNAASLLEISTALNHQHQLVAQRIKILLKLALIEASADPMDKRRTLYRLTKEGKHQGEILQDYCKEAADVFVDLSSEVGVNLLETLHQASVALQRNPLLERFTARSKSQVKRKPR